MRKTINFNKGFIPCAILSCLIILTGVVGLFVKGINFGLDFKPGLIEEVRVAEPVANIVYNGSAKISLDMNAGQMDLDITGTGIENETKSFNFAVLSTVSQLAAELNKVADVHMTVTDGSYETTKLFLNSAVSNQLTNTPMYLYPAGTSTITTDDLRSALGDESVAIKQLGNGADASYQIRMAVSEGDAQNDLQTAVNEKLYSKFGKENVAIVKTDFIGAGMSKSTTRKSIFMFICVIVLIWVYAAIRFHWDFALGSVIALLHDTLIMFTFICWSGMEFSTTVLAAVLTIVGYSINDTVVILDRVRSNLRIKKVDSFNQLLDRSLSDTLGRSIITTVTTLFAVIALYVFTSGSIKDFALALMVGLLSGCYSSLFISSGIISMCRRNWKQEFGIHHSLKEETGVLQMDTGVTV